MTDREKLVQLIDEVAEGTVFVSAGEQQVSINSDDIADHLIANGVTVREWITVEDRLPELPDRDFCGVYVNALYLDTKEVVPRHFTRSIVRGKRVERWRYPWDRLAKAPDFWMPLPSAEGSV